MAAASDLKGENGQSRLDTHRGTSRVVQSHPSANPPLPGPSTTSIVSSSTPKDPHVPNEGSKDSPIVLTACVV